MNLVKVVVVTGEVEMEVVLKVAGGSLPSIRGSTGLKDKPQAPELDKVIRDLAVAYFFRFISYQSYSHTHTHTH